jgi:hypothetical protein
MFTTGVRLGRAGRMRQMADPVSSFSKIADDFLRVITETVYCWVTTVDPAGRPPVAGDVRAAESPGLIASGLRRKGR